MCLSMVCPTLQTWNLPQGIGTQAELSQSTQISYTFSFVVLLLCWKILCESHKIFPVTHTCKEYLGDDMQVCALGMGACSIWVHVCQFPSCPSPSPRRCCRYGIQPIGTSSHRVPLNVVIVLLLCCIINCLSNSCSPCERVLHSPDKAVFVFWAHAALSGECIHSI